MGLVITLRLLRAVLGWMHRHVGSHSSRSRLEDEENSMGDASADPFAERTAVTVPCVRTSAHDVTASSQAMVTAAENLPAGSNANEVSLFVVELSNILAVIEYNSSRIVGVV